jgi:hypothetical protein
VTLFTVPLDRDCAAPPSTPHRSRNGHGQGPFTFPCVSGTVRNGERTGEGPSGAGSGRTSPDGHAVHAPPLPLDAYSGPGTLIGSRARRRTCGCGVGGTRVRSPVTAGRNGAFRVAQPRHNDSSNCRRRLFSALECVSGRNRFVTSTRTSLENKALREATSARKSTNRLAFPSAVTNGPRGDLELRAIERSTGGMGSRLPQKTAVSWPPGRFYCKKTVVSS